MADLLKTGGEWLQQTLQDHASTAVVYVTAAGNVSVSAGIGQTRHETTNREGFPVVIETRDFLIPAAELVQDSAQVEPERGHQIRQTAADGTVHLYDVTSPGPGIPIWRWADRHHSRRRVHTLYRGTA